MNPDSKSPVVVVVQLTGGNDYLNSVIPYTDSNYYENRLSFSVSQEDVVKLDTQLGLHPTMAPMKEIYGRGDLAIINGVGYENSPRSHFRSMDIWHTCEPDKIGTEGWLGRAIRDLDPKGDNPITGVNIGQALPRALTVPGVPVASVSDLNTYGLLTNIEDENRRTKVLERFSNMYGQAIGSGPVNDYLARTGLDALKGADILKEALDGYSSTVEYGSSSISKSLRDVAMIHTANLGTRVFYTQLGSFDTHASQPPVFDKLWTELSRAITDFWEDLKNHEADKEVVMFLFSEFGRRVKDNGSGTDHGAAGACFALGPSVKGGIYGEYPSTDAADLEQGDLVPNQDFRGVYSTIAEDWLGLDAVPIVDGHFEKLNFIE
ncbi:MAG: DUF1501 domain-containing protein [Dehalococcoidia bacterium]